MELSIPHPAEIKTVVDALGLSYEKERHWITKMLMLDRAHQAIGRNSGYRWDGYQCVVLADKHIHRSLVSETRYLIDKENSVLIDRLASMSRKDRRTTSTASPLVQEIESLLNTLDAYLADNRKVRPDIDHVVKAIEPEGKRSQYVCRLLIALTTLSGVRFDCNEDSTDVGNTRQHTYRELGDWVLAKWVPREKWDSVWKEYRNTLGVPENENE